MDEVVPLEAKVTEPGRDPPYNSAEKIKELEQKLKNKTKKKGKGKGKGNGIGKGNGKKGK